MRTKFRTALAIVPVVLVVAGCGADDGSAVEAEPTAPVVASPTPTPTPSDSVTPSTSATPGGTSPGSVDWVAGGVWHKADGGTVKLPKAEYFGAVLWNGKLVATRSDGEVYALADVVAADGTVVETLKTTASVVANEAGTTIAWVATDGTVQTAWDGGRVQIGKVDLAAAGETVAYTAAAVTGGPSCMEADGGCVVYLNSGEGKPRTFDSHGVNDNPVPSVVEYNDVSKDLLVTYTDKIKDDGSCGGLRDLAAAEATVRWTSCEFEVGAISPDGKHVIGPPSYYDGLGISAISVLDAATGKPSGRYAPEGGFMSQWAWSADGRLVFDLFGGGKWQLIAMTSTGEITEIGTAVAGDETDSPFALIAH